jgi:hypothetical protein
VLQLSLFEPVLFALFWLDLRPWISADLTTIVLLLAVELLTTLPAHLQRRLHYQ